MANTLQDAKNSYINAILAERDRLKTELERLSGGTVVESSQHKFPEFARIAAEKGGDNATRVLAFIRANPGCKGEEINAACGFEGAQLVAVRHKLGKAIRTKGRRRGMRYYVKEGK